MTGSSPLLIGLIINPIAGMGGSVGLKGTDGATTLAQAVALGAAPVASARALRAIARLAAAKTGAVLLTCPGAMGEDVAYEAGLTATLVGDLPPGPTTAAHTSAAAAKMRDRGVALILFAGGDGTARDVLAAVGSAVPILGIPSGVKMHSAAFAVTPEAAGQLTALVAARAEALRYREAEIMDVDEASLRAGRLSSRLYGYARIPFERHLVQGMKQGGLAEDAALDALCHEIADEMAGAFARGVAYLIGPGTTTQRILTRLGLAGTLLGVDAVRDGHLIGTDLRGDEVEHIARAGPAKIVISVIGGQGYVFGRGNAQLGPAAIRTVGRANLIVLASQRKLSGLDPPHLRVDTGDPALDRELQGYIRVRIGPGQSTMLRIAS
jgi:predicted polyphosphate/ATP-dependent NAD kinase